VGEFVIRGSDVGWYLIWGVAEFVRMQWRWWGFWGTCMFGGRQEGEKWGGALEDHLCCSPARICVGDGLRCSPARVRYGVRRD